jgi:hypothetical protein
MRQSFIIIALVSLITYTTTVQHNNTCSLNYTQVPTKVSDCTRANNASQNNYCCYVVGKHNASNVNSTEKFCQGFKNATNITSTVQAFTQNLTQQGGVNYTLNCLDEIKFLTYLFDS